MQTIIITLNNGKKEEYVKGIKVKEILNKMSKEEREDAILIKYNNKKVDLETELKKNGTLQIYDINTLEGNRIYERGLLYLFIYVTNNVLGKDTKVIVKHSIDKGIFCKIDKKVEDKDVLEIKKQMKEIVSKNISFTKMDTTKYEAIEYFKSIKREDKAKTLFYDTSKYVSLYKLDENYNYIVGDLPSSTGVLKYFDLSLIKDKGIVVRFPSIYDNKKVKRYTHHTNYFNTLEEYSAWGNNLNINNIGELNDYITSNKPADIIQLSEIMQDLRRAAGNLYQRRRDVARHVRDRRRVGSRGHAAREIVGSGSARAARYGDEGAVPVSEKRRSVAGAGVGDAGQRRHLLLVQLRQPADGPHLGVPFRGPDADRHAGRFRHVCGQYRRRSLCRPVHARAGCALHARHGLSGARRHLLRGACPLSFAGADVSDYGLPLLRIVAPATADPRKFARRRDARRGARASLRPLKRTAKT